MFPIIYQLIDEAFRESLSENVRYTDSRLRVIERIGPISMKDLAGKERVSVAALTPWVKGKAAMGLVRWCDREGKPEGSFAFRRWCCVD